MDQAGTARPWLTLTTFSRSMACATALRTFRLSNGGFVVCGSRYQVPGNGYRKTSFDIRGSDCSRLRSPDCSAVRSSSLFS